MPAPGEAVKPREPRPPQSRAPAPTAPAGHREASAHWVEGDGQPVEAGRTGASEDPLSTRPWAVAWPWPESPQRGVRRGLGVTAKHFDVHVGGEGGQGRSVAVKMARTPCVTCDVLRLAFFTKHNGACHSRHWCSFHG